MKSTTVHAAREAFGLRRANTSLHPACSRKNTEGVLAEHPSEITCRLPACAKVREDFESGLKMALTVEARFGARKHYFPTEEDEALDRIATTRLEVPFEGTAGVLTRILGMFTIRSVEEARQYEAAAEALAHAMARYRNVIEARERWADDVAKATAGEAVSA